MMQFKRYILSLLTVITLGFAAVPLAMPALTFADAQTQACKGIGGTESGGDCKTTGDVQVGQVIEFAVELLSVVVGIAAVIMIIIGGFKYVTSNGDANGIASAKNTIIYAIVGLIIAALAQVIARFVIASV